METPTLVTITVPLVMTLELANQIEREAQHAQQSIPEMLSLMLADAYEDRERQEHNGAAHDLLHDIPVMASPSLTLPTFDLPRPPGLRDTPSDSNPLP